MLLYFYHELETMIVPINTPPTTEDFEHIVKSYLNHDFPVGVMSNAYTCQASRNEFAE